MILFAEQILVAALEDFLQQPDFVGVEVALAHLHFGPRTARHVAAF